MFGGYFIMSGINHFKEKQQMTQYAAAKKVPKPGIAVHWHCSSSDRSDVDCGRREHSAGD